MVDIESEKKSGPWTRAKNRVHDFVVALAEAEGIDQKTILFKWDIQEGMIPDENDTEIKQIMCILKIYLGKKSETLTFSGPAFSKSNENPEKFLSEYRDQIIAAVRKLKCTEKDN